MTVPAETAGAEGGATAETPPAVVPWWRRVDRGTLLVLVVVLAGSASGLANGFAYDDVPIVRENAAVQAWRWPWAFLDETYWMPPVGQALYRPFTVWLFSVQWMIGGGSALPFHLVNVAAYAVASLLLLRVARELVRPSVALALAAIWAAHPVHVEVVGNVVGQSELWVALSGLTAVSVVRRIIGDGRVTPNRMLSVLIAVLVGLGAKENGIVLPALVVGMLVPWLRSAATSGPARTRGWVLVRACGYAVGAYLVMRFSALGTLGGDGSHLAIAALSTGERLFAALALRVEEVRLLLMGGPLSADYAPPNLPLHTSPDGWHLVAAAVLASWGAAAWWLRRARRPVWPLLWVPLALAPTSNVLFATGIVLAERSLFTPSLGAALAFGLVADLLITRVGGAIGPPVRRAAVAMIAVIVASGAWASARRQPVWRDSHTLVATSLIDAPTSPNWQRVLGSVLLRSEEFDRAEIHFRIAEALGPPDLRLLNGMRMALERQGRCAEALPYYRRQLAMYQRSWVVEMGEVSCLLRVRRYTEARLLALGAGVEAPEPEPFRLLRQLAESALVATDTVGPTNLWGLRGRPAVRSDAVIAVGVDDRGGLVRYDLPPVGGDAAAPVPADGSPDGPRVAHPKG